MPDPARRVAMVFSGRKILSVLDRNSILRPDDLNQPPHRMQACIRAQAAGLGKVTVF
jgi:hypothetical protein